MQLDVEVSPPAFVREILNDFEHLLMEFHSIQIKEFISLSLQLEQLSSTWHLPISVTFGPVWLLVQSHPDIHTYRKQCIRAHRAYTQVGSKIEKKLEKTKQNGCISLNPGPIFKIQNLAYSGERGRSGQNEKTVARDDAREIASRARRRRHCDQL